MGMSADQTAYARILLADPGSSAIQQILLANATGGTWTISYGGQTTTALNWNATAAEVQNALAALSTIGIGNISVTNSGALTPYQLYFTGTLAYTALAIVTTTSSLSGVGASITVTQIAAGGVLAFTNDQLDILYNQANANFYLAIAYAFEALAADTSRLHDYVAGQSQEKMSQVFSHLRELAAYYQQWAFAAAQVQPVRMVSVPPRLRAYPRTPGVPSVSVNTHPVPWYWRGPRGGGWEDW